MSVAVKSKKLKIGHQGDILQGFATVDILPDVGADFVADARDLSKVCPENNLEALYASHVLEHFPRTETLDVLKHWRTRLQPGGLLYVAVPDFGRVVDLYYSIGLNEWMVEFLWGGQGRPYDVHLAGFDEKRLGRLLVEAGFGEVKRVQQFGLGEEDCSTLVSQYCNLPVSLNMIAKNNLKEASQ